jgi:CPA2 family monovalent cation:H+ antiporter-2
MPTLAVLRPLMGAAYGMPLLLLAVLAIALYLWKSAGAIAAEYRSGAEELAEILGRQSEGEEHPEVDHHAALLPGLESSRPFLVASGPAVGRTLAELDLRARTGASVVTIRRHGERLLLPTGHERLERGDVLALVGSEEALARALALLATEADASARA